MAVWRGLGSFEAREAQAAIRHALGARSASQIDGWIGAATLDLTSAGLAEIDAAIARAGAVHGPSRPALLAA